MDSLTIFEHPMSKKFPYQLDGFTSEKSTTEHFDQKKIKHIVNMNTYG